MNNLPKVVNRKQNDWDWYREFEIMSHFLRIVTSQILLPVVHAGCTATCAGCTAACEGRTFSCVCALSVCLSALWKEKSLSYQHQSWQRYSPWQDRRHAIHLPWGQKVRLALGWISMSLRLHIISSYTHWGTEGNKRIQLRTHQIHTHMQQFTILESRLEHVDINCLLRPIRLQTWELSWEEFWITSSRINSFLSTDDSIVTVIYSVA